MDPFENVWQHLSYLLSRIECGVFPTVLGSRDSSVVSHCRCSVLEYKGLSLVVVGHTVYSVEGIKLTDLEYDPYSLPSSFS